METFQANTDHAKGLETSAQRKHYDFSPCFLSCAPPGHSVDSIVLLHPRNLIQCDYQRDCSTAVPFDSPYPHNSEEQKAETHFCEFAKANRVPDQGNIIPHSTEEPRRTVDVLWKNNSLRVPWVLSWLSLCVQ